MKFLALAFLPLCLSAAESPKLRLPGDVEPTRYELDLNLAPAKDGFDGTIAIEISVKKPASVIWLHSDGLTIASAKVGGQTAKIVPGDTGFIGLSLSSAIPVGRSKIEIAYSGQFQKTDVEGLFKQTEGGDSYVLTQFEPTSARRAFPCFDEPAFKTPWKITLRVPKALLAFANTPVEAERVSGETKIVQFRESKPLPTYLVAMAVGPFEIIDGGVAGRNKTPLRVITTRGHKDEAKHTLEVTPKVFNALEEYFGIPYPYEKLDQITIPVTVAFGAMENAGLITYQSSILLIRPQDDTVPRRRSSTSVIAHEIAHQWFGNMVTPAWWDDIWLNEAFASWMEERVEEQLFPSWKTTVSAVGKKSKVMGLDSMLSARKIRQPIMNEGDIGSAFDGITYTKGSAVIRMFEAYVGQDAMRKGIQNYMKKHAWGAATARDFLMAISDASGKNVTSAFSTFLDRTGVPLLNVTVNCSQGAKPSVTVTQERFVPIGSKGNRAEYWQVPACFEYESGGKVSRQCSCRRGSALCRDGRVTPGSSRPRLATTSAAYSCSRLFCDRDSPRISSNASSGSRSKRALIAPFACSITIRVCSASCSCSFSRWSARTSSSAGERPFRTCGAIVMRYPSSRMNRNRGTTPATQRTDSAPAGCWDQPRHRADARAANHSNPTFNSGQGSSTERRARRQTRPPR